MIMRACKQAGDKEHVVNVAFFDALMEKLVAGDDEKVSLVFEYN